MKNIVTFLFLINSVILSASTIMETGIVDDRPIVPEAIEESVVDEMQETLETMEEPEIVVPEVVKEPETKKEVVEKPVPNMTVNERDLECLACVIYQEAGGLSETTRFMVGDVVLNRKNYGRYFPTTIEGVLTQKYQYGTLWKTGIVWPERSKHELEKNAVDEAYDIARRLLLGEHSDLYGKGYIFQAEFEQGTNIIESEGLYFGCE